MSPIILSDFAGVMDRKRQAAVGAAPSAVRRGVYDGGAGMSAAPTLSQTWAEFVLAMLKRNGPFGLFTLTEEREFRDEFGLTLRQRDEAIDHPVATGWAHLRAGEAGVWLEMGAPS
jgi:hypothetical protein